MKINTLYCSFLLISLTLITSCKKEEEEIPTLEPNKQIILSKVEPIPATSTYVPPSNPQTVTQQPVQTVTQDQQVINQKQVVTKPGMNPPHGQPGHRCEIAVGAPLNSKPKQAVTKTGSAETQKITINPNQKVVPAGNTATTPAILNPDTAATATEPGMNPPHGQPGHVCGTPVGSPLPK